MYCTLHNAIPVHAYVRTCIVVCPHRLSRPTWIPCQTKYGSKYHWYEYFSINWKTWDNKENLWYFWGINLSGRDFCNASRWEQATNVCCLAGRVLCAHLHTKPPSLVTYLVGNKRTMEFLKNRWKLFFRAIGIFNNDFIITFDNHTTVFA